MSSIGSAVIWKIIIYPIGFVIWTCGPQLVRTAWEGLGGVVLLEEASGHFYCIISASWLQFKMCSLSLLLQLPYQPTAMLPAMMVLGPYPSVTTSPIKPFLQ